MSRATLVEAPYYVWEGGYHINNGKTFSDLLAAAVVPSLAGLPNGSVVADFGCGNGRFARGAVAQGAGFVIQGYELNPTAVEEFNTEFAHTPHRAEVADLKRLDVGRDRFHAALLWRVLHAIEEADHEAVLRGIAQSLRPESSLHVAVRSDRDWVAADLRRRGFYKSGEMNECFPAMAAALVPEGVFRWPLYFFRPGELARLGKRVGLAVVHQESIQEPSGYEVLRRTRPPLSYDYVEFVKKL